MVKKVESAIASFIGTIAFFAFIGWLLKKHIDTDINVMAICIFVGFINAIAYIGYKIYKDVYK